MWESVWRGEVSVGKCEKMCDVSVGEMSWVSVGGVGKGVG